MPRRDPLTTIYVVEWPRLNIVKAGSTILPSRVRKFINRGAEIIALIPDQPIETERMILRRLSEVGRPAYARWQDAVGELGAGGTGYSECFVVSISGVRSLRRWLRTEVAGAVVQS